MTEQDEDIEISGEEADMLKRMREKKVDPKTIGLEENANRDGQSEAAAAAEEPKVDIEKRVNEAVTKATAEVKAKSLQDTMSNENRTAMRETVKADGHFGEWVKGDPKIYGDIEDRVAEELKDPEGLEKIKQMSRAEFLDLIRDKTAVVMDAMKKRFGVSTSPEELDTRLSAASTGVSGSGGRRSGSGEGNAPKELEPLPYGAMGRDEKFPTQAEIERRHDTRMKRFIAKEGIG